MIENSGHGELGPWDPKLDDVEAHLNALREQRSREAGTEDLDLRRMSRPKTPEELRAVLPIMTARVERAFPRAFANVSLSDPNEAQYIEAAGALATIAKFDVPLDTQRLRVERISANKIHQGDKVAKGIPGYVFKAYVPEIVEDETLPFLHREFKFSQEGEGAPGKWFDLTLPGLQGGRLHPRHGTFVMEAISDYSNIFGTELYFPLADEGDVAESGRTCHVLPLLPLPHQRDQDILDREGPQAVYFDHLRTALFGLEAAAL